MATAAERYGNDARVEEAWAAQALLYAEVYERILASTPIPRVLLLTRMDDAIYQDFRQTFPLLKVDSIDYDATKTGPEKERWRGFSMKYEGLIKDFNTGTLVRVDCSKPLSETNSFLAVRMQFYAIEIARNREGFNDAFAAIHRLQSSPKS